MASGNTGFGKARGCNDDMHDDEGTAAAAAKWLGAGMGESAGVAKARGFEKQSENVAGHFELGELLELQIGLLSGTT